MTMSNNINNYDISLKGMFLDQMLKIGQSSGIRYYIWKRVIK